jgi:hypothetical protein
MASNAVNATTFCGCTIILTAGDVIRAHDGGQLDATADQNVYFHITRVSG